MLWRKASICRWRSITTRMRACFRSFGTDGWKVRNAVLVAVSEGLGTAILAGGQLHSGFYGLAGEFGHISVDPAGPVCGCGQRGCWEMSASSRAALQAYRKLVPKSSVGSIEDLLRLAEEGDPAGVKAVSAQAMALGRGLLDYGSSFPELILITGEITVLEQIRPDCPKGDGAHDAGGAPAPTGDRWRRISCQA